MPWNFNAHYKHVQIKNLDAPIDLESQFIDNREATVLFKDLVEGILDDDLSHLSSQMEPLFYRKA